MASGSSEKLTETEANYREATVPGRNCSNCRLKLRNSVICGLVKAEAVDSKVCDKLSLQYGMLDAWMIRQ